MHPELRGIVEDFERLWAIAGFAEQFVANLVLPRAAAVPGDPYDLVLGDLARGKMKPKRAALIEALTGWLQ